MNGIEYDGWVPSHVREYLKDLGYRLPLEDMEPHILEWDECMSATGDFYNYRDTDSFGCVYQVHRRSIKPAMRVCREWGSLLLNEQTRVVCEDQTCTDWLDAYFSNTGFMGQAQANIARAFGLGTGAFALFFDIGRRKVKIRHFDARMVETAKEAYGSDLKASHKKHIERKIKADADSMLHRKMGDYKIQRNMLEKERLEAIAAAETDAEEEAANLEYEQKSAEALQKFKDDLSSSRDELVKSAGQDVVRTVETAKKEQKKRDIEDGIRDHLRGFSRTIPSFLMAYGDESTTLEAFDTIIPDEVFKT